MPKKNSKKVASGTTNTEGVKRPLSSDGLEESRAKSHKVKDEALDVENQSVAPMASGETTIVRRSSRVSRKVLDLKPENVYEDVVERVSTKVLKKEKEYEAAEEEEDEEETRRKQPIKKKAASTRKKEPIEEKPDAVDTTETTIKTIQFVGAIPIDERFHEQVQGYDYKIHKEGDDVYDCMLNQTNLQYNNNKYYLIQLIESLKDNNYLVWMRWGRVGKSGQTNLQRFGRNLEKAKEVFCKKFVDKTGNEWDERDQFEKYPGKYDLVHKDYAADAASKENADNDDETETKEKKEPRVVVPESKLDKRVQELTELICNVSQMEAMLKEMKYDARKSPLGKLSSMQIKAGYAALKQIEDLVRQGKTHGRDLVEANNLFYTRIPHDFGMRTPPIINNLAQLKEKVLMLETLDDIQVAVKALNQQSDIVNPIDRHYEQLECAIRAMDTSAHMYSVIEAYVRETHAPTHANYTLELMQAFEVEKSEQRFNGECGNRMLLWHGSRLTNWAGILSGGLKIAPPEAPVTGYMFGKGCYFADCSSKSANYCYTNASKNVGILALCEVALGTSRELKQADHDAGKLPKGAHSTKGVGKSQPDKANWVTLDDGCVVPIGRMKSTLAKDEDPASYALLYNEYVVYNVDQIRLRYLVKVKFNYGVDDDDDDE